jgi:hypothetical protein
MIEQVTELAYALILVKVQLLCVIFIVLMRLSLDLPETDQSYQW